MNDPKTPDGASLRAWDRALRSRQRRQDGVTDGRRYRTRRDAEDRAASYRRQLADRGLETESVVRRHYMHYGRWVWRVVLWRKGHRPGQVVERALAARERAKAKREAENIERGWW